MSHFPKQFDLRSRSHFHSERTSPTSLQPTCVRVISGHLWLPVGVKEKEEEIVGTEAIRRKSSPSLVSGACGSETSQEGVSVSEVKNTLKILRNCQTTFHSGITVNPRRLCTPSYGPPVPLCLPLLVPVPFLREPFQLSYRGFSCTFLVVNDVEHLVR